MNLTTLWISGLAVSLFAAAIAVRATRSPTVPRTDWLHLPPLESAPEALAEREAAPAQPPPRPGRLRSLERTYERALRKDERAKQEAAEALRDLQHARRKLATAPRNDEVTRTHWERSQRSATLRYESATHQRRQALLSIDGVRRALEDQMGGLPSRVSFDSSK